jgi:hypothetical protein
MAFRAVGPETEGGILNPQWSPVARTATTEARKADWRDCFTRRSYPSAAAEVLVCFGFSEQAPRFYQAFLIRIRGPKSARRVSPRGGQGAAVRLRRSIAQAGRRAFAMEGHVDACGTGRERAHTRTGKGGAVHALRTHAHLPNSVGL